MDELALSPLLKDLKIGPIRSFLQIDSTNDEAARWVDQGAPDLSLVFADEQTAGKGRLGRQWFTPSKAALAFSLVLDMKSTDIPESAQFRLREEPREPAWMMMRLTALGAVAVCETLQKKYSLHAQIKWPNDILLNRRKTSGILVEAHWHADQLMAAQLLTTIIGIGINIASPSVPPAETVIYPATCIEYELGHPIDRFDLLHGVLESMVGWRGRIHEPAFIQTWNDRLAFKGEWVGLSQQPRGAESTVSPVFLIGLADDGRLRLRDKAGKETSLISGELSLRPADHDPE